MTKCDKVPSWWKYLVTFLAVRTLSSGPCSTGSAAKWILAPRKDLNQKSVHGIQNVFSPSPRQHVLFHPELLYELSKQTRLHWQKHSLYLADIRSCDSPLPSFVSIFYFPFHVLHTPSCSVLRAWIGTRGNPTAISRFQSQRKAVTCECILKL